MTIEQRNNAHPVNAFDCRTWDEDARTYFNNVDELWRNGDNLPFRNGRPLHAAYLIHKLFLHAESSIRLYSGELIRKVEDSIDKGMLFYSDPTIIEAIKLFLAKEGSQFKIVLESDVDVDDGQEIGDHPLMQAISSWTGNDGEEGGMKGSIAIREVCPSALSHIKETKGGRANVHMLLMDNSAFRLEYNTDDKSAFVNFNDKDLMKVMIGFFDDVLFDRGKELWRLPDNSHRG